MKLEVHGLNEMLLQTMDVRSRKEGHEESLRLRLEVLVVCTKYSNGSINELEFLL